MNTIVPLISSGVAGPLGVLHLPRLWLKLSLESVGKLAPGYPGAGKGYDQMVIDGIGLNRGRFMAPALGPAFEVLATVKAALDPRGILNPGKLGLPSPFGQPPWP